MLFEMLNIHFKYYINVQDIKSNAYDTKACFIRRVSVEFNSSDLMPTILCDGNSTYKLILFNASHEVRRCRVMRRPLSHNSTETQLQFIRRAGDVSNKMHKLP